MVGSPLNQTRAPTSIMNRVQQLKQHPDRFFELFRMTPSTFQYLLNLVINRIRRQDTQMRRAIDAETRLCITLHHLTSGVNFRNLAFIYAIGRRTVSEIVYDTCDAIGEIVGALYMKMPASQQEWQAIANR